MTHGDLRPWISVSLVILALAYVGCTSSPTEPIKKTATPPTPATTPATPPATSTKLIANLGDPVGVLIVSGERNGYMEPCGCSEDQSGGLIRLYDLVERLHQQNLPTAFIDLGGLIKNPATARGGFEQTKIKLDYAIKALALLKCSALGLSAEDLKVGVSETLGLFLNSLGETRIVAANIEPNEAYASLFRPSVITRSGPVRLGVTAVTDPASLEGLADPEREALLPKILRPEDALPKVLADLESKSDYQILMVQGPPDLARRLAGAYPGFDIVVSTSEFPDPLNHDPELLNGGKTMLVTVGQKGKNVGVFGFYKDGEQAPKYQLVTLNKRYDGPATAMKKLIQTEYRETLKAAGIVENILRHDLASAPTGSRFVGVDACKTCHPKTVEHWKTTKHAEAYETLLHDPKPNTQYDAECILCHTTGFEINSGWVSADKTPHLLGNQCENCHGPASRHVAEPDNRELRKAIALTTERADRTRQCLQCHDEENSREFEFTGYESEIHHKGLDDYSDPKVHKGAAAQAVAPKAGASGP